VPTSKEKKVKIRGKEIRCPICGNDKFFQRNGLMETPGMTFLGLDWMNKEAYNFICSDCGYVYWFLRDIVESEFISSQKERKVPTALKVR
jgi:predicted nucleic-acid-binding Zn-ribbon protein